MAATYCFLCRSCGERWTNSADHLGLHPTNDCTDFDIIRDYRAEGVGIGSGVRESRLSKGVQDMRTYRQWAEGEADAVGLR